jgi:hypothetical protein
MAKSTKEIIELICKLGEVEFIPMTPDRDRNVSMDHIDHTKDANPKSGTLVVETTVGLSMMKNVTCRVVPAHAVSSKTTYLLVRGSVQVVYVQGRGPTSKVEVTKLIQGEPVTISARARRCLVFKGVATFVTTMHSNDPRVTWGRDIEGLLENRHLLK